MKFHAINTTFALVVFIALLALFAYLAALIIKALKKYIKSEPVRKKTRKR